MVHCAVIWYIIRERERVRAVCRHSPYTNDARVCRHLHKIQIFCLPMNTFKLETAEQVKARWLPAAAPVILFPGHETAPHPPSCDIGAITHRLPPSPIRPSTERSFCPE